MLCLINECYFLNALLLFFESSSICKNFLISSFLDKSFVLLSKSYSYCLINYVTSLNIRISANEESVCITQSKSYFRTLEVAYRFAKQRSKCCNGTLVAPFLEFCIVGILIKLNLAFIYSPLTIPQPTRSPSEQPTSSPIHPTDSPTSSPSKAPSSSPSVRVIILLIFCLLSHLFLRLYHLTFLHLSTIGNMCHFQYHSLTQQAHPRILPALRYVSQANFISEFSHIRIHLTCNIYCFFTSHQPTKNPSSSPSKTPSKAPSSPPTSAPTISSHPSILPSDHPSVSVSV